MEDRLVWLLFVGPQTLEVDLHDSIQWAVKLLLRFDAPIIQPAISRILSLTIWWFGSPRNVPPENRLMKRGRFENRPSIDSVVEEHDQCRSPVVPNGERLLPTPWPFQLVRGEVERIQIRLGQIVTAGHVPLWLGFWKSRKFLQKVLLPSPREKRSEILAGFVGRSSSVRSAVTLRFLIDPVEKFSKVRSANLIDINSLSPGGPLGDG